MASKRGPQTLAGQLRKMSTGDGRRKSDFEKVVIGTYPKSMRRKNNNLF